MPAEAPEGRPMYGALKATSEHRAFMVESRV